MIEAHGPVYEEVTLIEYVHPCNQDVEERIQPMTQNSL